MASQIRIFVADLGMQTLSFAEFRTNAWDGLVLHSFAQEELNLDSSANTSRPEQLKITLRALRVKAKIKKGEKLHVSIPSQAAFIRFVKLPGAQPEDGSSGKIVERRVFLERGICRKGR